MDNQKPSLEIRDFDGGGESVPLEEEERPLQLWDMTMYQVSGDMGR